MRILFLNQYFPPDAAPTGILFREVADEFLRLGHEVDFVDAGQDYRGAQGGGGRMKRELAALWRMLREGRARPKADVVVSGSSPPCLGVVADRVARKHGAAHIHWAMDMYPELAVELGEIGRDSLVAKVTRWAMRMAWHPGLPGNVRAGLWCRRAWWLTRHSSGVRPSQRGAGLCRELPEAAENFFLAVRGSCVCSLSKIANRQQQPRPPVIKTMANLMRISKLNGAPACPPLCGHDQLGA